MGVSAGGGTGAAPPGEFLVQRPIVLGASILVALAVAASPGPTAPPAAYSGPLSAALDLLSVFGAATGVAAVA